MTNKPPFTFDSEGRAHISGPLTLDTVATVFADARKAMGGEHQLTDVDLSEVPRVDSSGLALLLEWQSAASRNGRSITFRNAPADLLTLSRLCESDDLLTIEKRNGTNPTFVDTETNKEES